MIKYNNLSKVARPVSQSTVDVLFSGAGYLRLKSQASQIKNNVANRSRPLLTVFLRGAVLPEGTMTLKWASQTCNTLRRNAACIMKHLF